MTGMHDNTFQLSNHESAFIWLFLNLVYDLLISI